MSRATASARAILLLVAIAGCARKPTTPPHASADTLATTTAPAAVEVTSTPHGVRLSYPSDWEPVPSGEYVLKLVAANGPEADDTTFGTAAMSLDVPRLPPHIPGLIPLGLVVNGYLDDLKAQAPDSRVDDSSQTTLAGRPARRVRSTRTADGRPQVEDAVLTTHGDRVYILRLVADARDYARARDAFEAVLASVRWMD